MEAMENIRLVLGKNLKDRRKQQGINQEALAERSGLSLTYIKNIERGVSWPSPESFEAISKGLGIPIGHLLDDGANGKPVVTEPVSVFAKKLLKIPDRIYELSQEVDPGHSVWKIIEGLLEVEAKEVKAKKATKNHA